MKKMAWFEYRVTSEFPTVIDEEEVLSLRDKCGWIKSRSSSQ
jgi:hypothetical protein